MGVNAEKLAAEHHRQMSEMALLWSRTQPIVMAFVCSAVHSFHDAEDIVQTVAVTIAQRFSEYDRDRPFAPWALGIARNTIRNYRQKRANDRLRVRRRNDAATGAGVSPVG